MKYARDTRNIILNNTHSHLVCLTPNPEDKTELLKSFSLGGIDLQGASFQLPNGTKVTIANLEGDIPSDEFHLAYHNWQPKKPFTPTQKNRIAEWEKKAKQIINLFE